jgi:hypothetical protein
VEQRLGFFLSRQAERVAGVTPTEVCGGAWFDQERARPRKVRCQRVCGKPRSTFDVAGSGQRDVTTLPRV